MSTPQLFANRDDEARAIARSAQARNKIRFLAAVLDAHQALDDDMDQAGWESLNDAICSASIHGATLEEIAPLIDCDPDEVSCILLRCANLDREARSVAAAMKEGVAAVRVHLGQQPNRGDWVDAFRSSVRALMSIEEIARVLDGPLAAPLDLPAQVQEHREHHRAIRAMRAEVDGHLRGEPAAAEHGIG